MAAPKGAFVEIGVLLASSLLLLWLNRGERAPEPLPGALVTPWLSVLAAVAVAWLTPGYVLCRLVREPLRAGRLQTAAFTAGLGLSWLTLVAAAALWAGVDLEFLAGSVAGLNGALVAGYAIVRLRGRADDPREAWRPAPAPPVLAAAAGAALAYLLAASAWRPRFSFGSDDWILLRAARYFLEARPIAYTFDFDVWDLQIALLVRLARVDLIDTYRTILPPLLIVMATLAFFALADVLFRDRTLSCLSYLLLAVYCLSDMQARGAGAGMAWLVRIAEDKHAACLIALPLAQAAFLWFIRRGGVAWIGIAAAIVVAGVAVYPLALVWFALTAGLTGIAAAWSGRVRLRPPAVAVLAVAAAAAVALAAGLRAQRPSPYFALHDPSWPFGAVLRGINRRHLLVLSSERGWYMAHPVLLAHPLVIAAVLAAVALLPRVAGSLRAQFLACSTFGPLLAVYNPLTATLLGAAITPWMVHRVLWAVPVALLLGDALHQASRWLEARGAARHALLRPLARHAVLPLLVVAAAAWLLQPRIGASWRALKARNRVAVTEGERALMLAVARDRTLAGDVLAPRGIGVRLPAWTSRLAPYPALDDLRWGDPSRLRAWTAFYDANAVGESEVALLRERGIEYVITRRGTPIDDALRRLPGPFKVLYDGDVYALYAWRPERWARAAVTSFDTTARNPEASLP